MKYQAKSQTNGNRNHMSFRSETRRRLKFIEDKPNFTPNTSELCSPNNKEPFKLPGLIKNIQNQEIKFKINHK